jgi:hypothetical protein
VVAVVGGELVAVVGGELVVAVVGGELVVAVVGGELVVAVVGGEARRDPWMRRGFGYRMSAPPVDLRVMALPSPFRPLAQRSNRLP